MSCNFYFLDYKSIHAVSIAFSLVGEEAPSGRMTNADSNRSSGSNATIAVLLEQILRREPDAVPEV